MKNHILHCDLNNFYASVECMKNPALKNRPIAVAGDKELRHGIILAKNQMAKEKGVKTGQTISEAKELIKELIVMPPDFIAYQHYSQMVKMIYMEYTDRVESFGIDEAWLDVRGSNTLFKDSMQIATRIQERVYKEVGLSLSIGVSYNKIFAKFGSDLNKPMGLTLITEDNFKILVWPNPVESLLYVGQATQHKLYSMGILTVGDLATYNIGKLQHTLGKWGEYLWCFANGLDKSEVAEQAYRFPVKSIGNGITPPRDMVNLEDVQLISYVLCESIAHRMREQNLVGRCVRVQMRSVELLSFSRQITLQHPVYTVQSMVKAVLSICEKVYDFKTPLRSISISISRLSSKGMHDQLSLFDLETQKGEEQLDVVMEEIRNRFGNFSIRRCSMKLDMELTDFDPYEENTIHPLNYFR